MKVELSEHQINAVKKLHSGSVLKGGVGTGKSRAALAWFFVKATDGRLSEFSKVDAAGNGTFRAPAKPKDLYVITTAKKRKSLDWVKEAARFAISTKREDSLSEILLTVDSWNNIGNYADVKNAVFIFDEQRLVGSGAWVKAFQKIAKDNDWIVLSATPGDTWMDYVPIFIANGFYKNRTEFIRRHVVYSNYTKFPKIDRYVEQGHLEKLRRRILVEMPYQKHTKRHIHPTGVQFDQLMFERVWTKRWHVFEDRPVRDVAELFAVARKVVNSDVSRLGAVMQVLEKHPRLIVFYNFNYELDMLRTLGTTLNYPIAEWNGQKHEDIPDTDKWIYLVQYTAGAEGWNCISTDATLFWSLNYSYKIYEQSQGRIDRLNTPYVDLHYYVLRSPSKIDQAIWGAIIKKKNFNEKDYFSDFRKDQANAA